MFEHVVKEPVEEKTARHASLTVIGKALATVKVVCLIYIVFGLSNLGILHGLEFYGFEFILRADFRADGFLLPVISLILLIFPIAAFIILCVLILSSKEKNWQSTAFAVISAADLIRFVISMFVWGASSYVVLGAISSAVCTAFGVVKRIVLRDEDDMPIRRNVRIVFVIIFALSIVLGFVLKNVVRQVLYTEVYEGDGVRLEIDYHPFGEITYDYDSDDFMLGGSAVFVSENRAEYPEEYLFHVGRIFRFTFIFDGDTVTVIDEDGGIGTETLKLISSTKDGK